VTVQQKHVLIVDDDAVFADAIGAVLRNAGFRATTSSHFDSALRVVEGPDPVHLLLADIVTPGGINGIALSRMARMRKRGIRVVYCTGHDIPGIDREVLGPVLRKPVDNDVLIDTLRDALASHPDI
jgi:DNA-binding NtrC family response regulator